MRKKTKLFDQINLWLVLVLIAVFLLGFAMVAGGQMTITWWYESATPQHLEAMKRDLIEPYEKIHPDVEVKLVVKQELIQILRTAISARMGPDIIMTMGPAEANRYAKVGVLVPLDKYIEEVGLDQELAPLALAVGKYWGEVYSIPKTFESMGLFFNETLFNKNGWGSPVNREGWNRLCTAIKAKDIIPVALGNASWRATNEWALTVYLNHYAGPENVYRALTQQLEWNNSIFVETIEMYKKDFLNYWPKSDIYFSLSESDYVPLVATRKAAMMVAGSWGFQWCGNPSYWISDDQWGWAPFPSLRQGVPYPLADVGVGTTLSVNKNSQYPDKTAEFLVWMLGYKEGIAKLLKDWPGEWLVPIEIPQDLVPEGTDPVFAKHFQTQSELLKKGTYGYTTWTFLGDQAWQWCYEGIEKVWLNQITPDEYMEKWQEAFQKDIEAGTVPAIPSRK